MSRKKDGQARGKFALEFKLEAVQLVKGGQSVPLTSKILGVPAQMELARLRAGLARVKMERDIPNRATAYFARESL